MCLQMLSRQVLVASLPALNFYLSEQWFCYSLLLGEWKTVRLELMAISKPLFAQMMRMSTNLSLHR